MAKRLNLYHRILTAADFVSADDLLLKRDFSVNDCPFSCRQFPETVPGPAASAALGRDRHRAAASAVAPQYNPRQAQNKQ